MIDPSHIEEKCRQLKLEKLPALNQLKLACAKKDFKTAEKIAINITDFIKETYNIIMPEVKHSLDRKSKEYNRSSHTHI
jgi:hypothetical protein